jgi:hypothetical protein
MLDDLGELGRVWRETDEASDLETVVSNLLEGRHKDPLCMSTPSPIPMPIPRRPRNEAT